MYRVPKLVNCGFISTVNQLLFPSEKFSLGAQEQNKSMPDGCK